MLIISPLNANKIISESLKRKLLLKFLLAIPESCYLRLFELENICSLSKSLELQEPIISFIIMIILSKLTNFDYNLNYIRI